ncbi:MAG: hypothetical protein R3A49_04055 [Acidimicrobiia bacterium]
MVHDTATPLRNPRRSALVWLARQLAWERTLEDLRRRAAGVTSGVKAAA